MKAKTNIDAGREMNIQHAPMKRYYYWKGYFTSLSKLRLYNCSKAQNTTQTDALVAKIYLWFAA